MSFLAKTIMGDLKGAVLVNKHSYVENVTITTVTIGDGIEVSAGIELILVQQT